MFKRYIRLLYASFLPLICGFAGTCCAQPVDLSTVAWQHGAADCEAEVERRGYVEWQAIAYQADTHIFRQNKCSNYEAPFVYLFIGGEQALLIDTGATEEGGQILLQTVRGVTDLPLVVAHSHEHGDHRLGDEAFQQAEGVTVVDVGVQNVRRFFGFSDWPHEPTVFDLGDREIELLPIPGHAGDDIAYYDPRSEFVVTGDTLYPGRLYIGSWTDYRASIARLRRWTEGKTISQVMGTHIEMSRTPDKDYPMGSTHQPDERQLPLSRADIVSLDDAVSGMETPQKTYFGSFILWPR